MTHARALARRVLPRGLVVWLRAARRLPLRRWPLYWRLRRAGLQPQGVRGVDSILFVCHGNIIRSPLAAAMLRRRLSASRAAAPAIASAGLHALPGQPADPRAWRVAAQFNVTLADHRAQQATADLIRQADMIVAMDAFVAAELLELYAGARHKVVMLDDVPDPYGGDEQEFRRCGERIHVAVERLASDLTGAAGATHVAGGASGEPAVTTR